MIANEGTFVDTYRCTHNTLFYFWKLLNFGKPFKCTEQKLRYILTHLVCMRLIQHAISCNLIIVAVSSRRNCRRAKILPQQQ